MVSTVVTVAMPARAMVESSEPAPGISEDAPAAPAGETFLEPSGEWHGPADRTIILDEPVDSSVVYRGLPAGQTSVAHVSASLRGSLPPGLTHRSNPDAPAEATLVGTPSKLGTYEFQLVHSYADAEYPDSISRIYRVTVVSPPPASMETVDELERPQISSGNPHDAEAGVAFSHQFTATGDNVVWSATSGSELPPGLSIDPATGLLSGTPSAVGRFSFGVQAANSGGSAQNPYQLTVTGAPELTSDAPAAAAARLPYRHQFTARYAEEAIWEIAPGSALPRGLTLDSQSGLLSGTPAWAGVSEFELRVSTPYGEQRMSSSVTVRPGAPVLDSVRETIRFGGDDDHDVLWITLDGTGRLHGVADYDEPANLSFTGTEYLAVELRTADDTVVNAVAVRGDESATAVAEAVDWPYRDGDMIVVRHHEAGSRLTAYSSGQALPRHTATVQRFVIRGQKLVRDAAEISSAAPAQGSVGQAYRHQLTGTGSGSHSWRVTTGALPEGLTLAGDTGVISGIPAKATSTSFTVQLTTAGGAVAKQFGLVVTQNEPVITSGAPPVGKAREAYSHQFAASNAADGTWTVASGALPVGVTLNAATGLLLGVPLRIGESTFEVALTSVDGVAQSSYTISVEAGAPLSDTFSERLEFFGSTGHQVMTVVLDRGRVRAFAENDVPANPEFADSPSYVSLELRDSTGTVLKSASVKGDESAAAVAEAMDWPYSESDLLVAGHLQPAGRLWAYSGGEAFPIEAAAKQSFVLSERKLGREVASITSDAPPQAKVGDAYQHQLRGTGAGPHRWRVVSGALPDGLTLHEASGLISGTPTRSGVVPIAVELTNYALEAELAFTLVVASDRPPMITTDTLPDAKVGYAYSHQLTATDAVGGEWSVAWSDPDDFPGLTVDPQSGLLSGTPSRTIAKKFTVRLTTPAGTTQQVLALQVNSNLMDSYPNAMQIVDKKGQDVLWVVIDAEKKQLFGVVTDSHASDSDFTVAMEDPDDKTMKEVGIYARYQDTGHKVAVTMPWPYEEKTTLIGVIHSTISTPYDSVRTYVDGGLQPNIETQLHRFMLVNDRLIRERQILITSPKSPSYSVAQPTLMGTAEPGKLLRIDLNMSPWSGGRSRLGERTVDSNGYWCFLVPASRSLPLGPVSLEVDHMNTHHRYSGRVNLEVVVAPPASLGLNAWTQRVLEMPERERWRRRD